MKVKISEFKKVRFGDLNPGDCFYRVDYEKSPETIAMKGHSGNDNAVYLFDGDFVVCDNDLVVIPVKAKITVK